MSATSPRELGDGRQMIDVRFRDSEGLVASYLLPQADGWTMVETGPTTCLPALRAGVSAAGIAPTEIRRIFVTHIHLDHAGGLGAAADAFPEAHLFVHHRGAAHMVDPTRLIASARRAWGAAADPLWGAIAPVPAHRLVALQGGEAFPLQRGELRVLDTPGHAQHHLAFFDTATGAMLTGDAAGVRVEGASQARPAVPPPDLDLAQLFDSLARMAALEPGQIWYSHFGPSRSAVGVLSRYRETVESWRAAALGAALEQPEVDHIARALRATEEARARAEGRPLSDLARAEQVSGYELAAQGLLRYFRTHGDLPG